MSCDGQDFVVLDARDIQGFNERGLLALPSDAIERIQTWLAPTDYAAPSSEYGKHLSSHLAGTGKWLVEDSIYRQWHDGLDRGTLWIKAIAGAGKSVIAASLASKFAVEEEVPVLYFFFRHIISANQKPQSLVRDWLSQLLQYSPAAQHSLFNLVDKQRSLGSVSVDELWRILVDSLAIMPRVYCVADALDEMDTSNDSFLRDLLDLGNHKSASIKLLLTSRPVPEVEHVLRDTRVLQINLLQRLVDPDISAYVRHRLASSEASSRLCGKVHEKMTTRADGHFLYARLMMDDLLDPAKNLLSDEASLVTMLHQLPTPMADMYTQMLSQHSQRSGVPQELQLALVRWVTRAERPLRLLELAAMIDFEQKAIGMTKDTKSIVRQGCGPLLEILEDETVCPIHHSFTEYLYDKQRSDKSSSLSSFPILDYKDTQKAIALTCIRYLGSGWHKSWFPLTSPTHDEDSGHKTEIVRLKFPFLNYAAFDWHKHVLKHNSTDEAVFTALDGLFQNSDAVIACLELTHVRRPYESLRKDFYVHWSAMHVASNAGLHHYLEHLTANGSDMEAKDLDEHTPMALAAKQGMADAVAVLLKSGAQNDVDDRSGLKPLHHAALGNHHNVVRLLLESGVDPCTPKTRENPGRWCGNSPRSVGETPVKYAAKNGHAATIQTLIPYLTTSGLHEALYWAVSEGQTKASMVLLETPGIDVNLVIKGQTPLWLASCARDVKIMRVLLGKGADPNISTSSSPLDAFVTSRRGVHRHQLQRLAIIEGITLLLDAGIDPNATDNFGQTILHKLAGVVGFGPPSKEDGDLLYDVFTLLLRNGMVATALDGKGSNALHGAAGFPATVLELLVRHGVDINQRRKDDGKTPLLCTLDSNRSDTAQALMDLGADANLADDLGNTPLHFAADRASVRDLALVKVTKSLIAAGADVKRTNHAGDTPLHLMGYLMNARPELLKLYLEHGLDLEVRNNKGYSILMFVVLRFNNAITQAEMLLEHGASPFTRTFDGRTVLHLAAEDIYGWGRTENLVRLFIHRGVDPLAVDHAGNNLWHVIARGAANYYSPVVRIFKFFEELGVSPLARNNMGQTPLHVASSVRRYRDELALIRFLLEQCGADVNVADRDLVRPIHLASSHSFTLVCFLLRKGADAIATTIEGQTPLMVACRTKQCNIVCRLLDHYRELKVLHVVNHKDKLGRTALHYACRSGRPESVRLLLGAGADANVRDRAELDPLLACAEYVDEKRTWERSQDVNNDSRIQAAYVLLSDRARPDIADNHSRPIRIRESIRLLVAHNADTWFLHKCSATLQSLPKWYNPLNVAMSNGCDAMVSELEILGCDVRQQCPECVREEADPSARQVIVEGAEVNFERKRWDVVSETFFARTRMLKSRHMFGLVSEMVRRGDSDYDHQRNFEMIKHLLEEDDEPSVEQINRLGVDILRCPNIDHSPMKQMVVWGFADLLDRIKYTPLAQESLEHRSLKNSHRSLALVLHDAITTDIPNLEVVQRLCFKFGADICGSYAIPDSDRTEAYVHTLARPRYWWQIKALELLLGLGANIEAKDSEGDTPLIVALNGSQDDYAADPTSVEAARVLLCNGADPNVIDHDGRSCLNIAANNPGMVKLLLDRGADPKLGWKPFIFDMKHLASVRELAPLGKFMELGVDVNALAQPGGDQVAQAGKDADCWEFDMATGEYDVPWSELDRDTLSYRAYPLHVAAYDNFIEGEEERNHAIASVKTLFEAGADPWLMYKDGLTIVHVLAETRGLVEPFLEEISVTSRLEARDKRGRSLLLAACDAKHDSFRQRKNDNPLPFLLIRHGASVLVTDNLGRNALHCLVEANTDNKFLDRTIPDFLALPSASALVKQPDAQGRTPIHYALAASRFDLIDLLLSHGADPLTPDPLDNSTALHHLARDLAHDLEFMLDPVDTILPNSDSRTPEEIRDYRTGRGAERCLVSASWSPRRHIAAFLALGADVNARDLAGETPLHKLLAKARDSVSTGLWYDYRQVLPAVRLLDSAGADFGARNLRGESALHKLAACQRKNKERRGPHSDADELKEAFRLVVTRGADVAWEDETHRTCLDVAAAAGSGTEWVLEMYKRK